LTTSNIVADGTSVGREIMCADREIRKFRKSTGCRKIHPSVNQVTFSFGDAAHNWLHLPEERRSPDVGGLQSMARLFISHSSRNNEKAIEVRDWLAANGWNDVFLDLDPERGIVAGQRWKEALQQAAYRCEVVLALVSAEWLASGWCKSEIDAARLMGIIVALTGIDKSEVPIDLLDEQFVDLSGDPQAYPRLKEGLKHAGLDPLSFPFEAGRRPYPGFAYFAEQDAAVFFGRDAQIVRGLDELRRLMRTGVSRMLVILGASGSGKSSFMRAGLWPRLRRDDRAWLPLPIIRPERAVISGTYGLVQALQQTISEPRFAAGFRLRGLPRSRPEINDFIEKTENGLVTLLDALREIGQAPRLSGENTLPPTIVIALDQGEELFNEEGRDEAERFIEILTNTLKADPRTLAIFAMRSDSFPLVQAHASLAALPKDTFTLDMMLEGSYRAVIEEPARLIQPTSLRVDPQLTDALLEEISGQDALPLLAFTLAHLYENYAADNELTLSGYDWLGRVKGVIDTAVKQAFATGVAKGELPKDTMAQLALARAAFSSQLAQVNAAGQLVRRVATLDQIPAEARPLIEAFAEQRLLIKDRRKNADGKECRRRRSRARGIAAPATVQRVAGGRPRVPDRQTATAERPARLAGGQAGGQASRAFKRFEAKPYARLARGASAGFGSSRARLWPGQHRASRR
jgi:hypothetical protein